MHVSGVSFAVHNVTVPPISDDISYLVHTTSTNHNVTLITT